MIIFLHIENDFPMILGASLGSTFGIMMIGCIMYLIYLVNTRDKKVATLEERLQEENVLSNMYTVQ